MSGAHPIVVVMPDSPVSASLSIITPTSRDDYFARLAQTIARAQLDAPLDHPVTIVCAPGARDDLIAGLVQHASAQGIARPLIGVQVFTVEGYILHRAGELHPRTMLQRRQLTPYVLRALAEHPAAEPLRQKKLDSEPATRSAVISAVAELTRLPESVRHETHGRELPGIVADIADSVLTETKADFFTHAQACVHAATSDGTFRIVAGVVADSPQQEEWLSQIADVRVATPRRFRGKVSAHTYVHDEDEVVAVLRTIRKKLAGYGGKDPVPAHRMAVALADTTYLPTVSRIFTAAGLPFRAPADGTLATHPVVQAVRLLTHSRPGNVSRRAIADALGSGVVQCPVSLSAFDSLTRGWTKASTLADLRAVGGQNNAASEIRYGELAEWWSELNDATLQVANSATWSDLATNVRALCERFINAGQHQSGLTALVDATESWSRWDGVTAPPTHHDLTELLTEFAGNPDASTAVDTGPLRVGTLDEVVGRDLDILFIVGAHSAALPPARTPDPCITDGQRGTTAKEALVAFEEVWNAALASADQVKISAPRTLIDGTVCHISGWVQHITDDIPVRYGLDSAIRAEGTAFIPYNDAEARWVKTWIKGDQDCDGRMNQIQSLRVSGAAANNPGAQFNGFLGPEAGRKAAESFFSREISASALESYLRSPLVFYIERIAGARLLEDPDPAVDIEARDRGTIYHSVLEEWTRRVWLDAQPRPTSHVDIDWTRALNILNDIISDHLDTVPHGRYSAASWSAFERDVREVCHRWFAVDKAQAMQGWVALAAEAAFGTLNRNDGTRPSGRMEITDLDGNPRQVRFHGSIDRIEYNPQTNTLRLVDYKTGRAKPKQDSIKQSPIGDVNKGWELQLALYGHVVRTVLDGAAEDGLLPEVEALKGANPILETRYWFITDNPPTPDEVTQAAEAGEDTDALIQQAGTQYSQLTDDLIHSAVTEIYQHMQQGHFMAYPDWFTDRFGPTEKMLALGAGQMRRAQHHFAEYMQFDLARHVRPQEDADSQDSTTTGDVR
ncbi:Inactivated superfamily I helicase [Corynebacterium renale]|nr:Inactivated superfamily I helicase [Corynebacterium renale]